ncbi:unnamed protein product [Candidula unifasciata]|uniref:CABIT domain-containing protein n=1 Tax=Candidula unifasciata TaxID=100452 RepID=A0A8S3YQ17_9EUPU|nr:unnamed protein product [Candidula unifasciata]
MLKWTKQKRRLSRAGKRDTFTADKTSDKTLEKSAKAGLQDNAELQLRSRASEQEKGYIPSSDSKDTWEHQTTRTETKSQLPQEKFNEIPIGDRFISPAKTDSPKLWTMNSEAKTGTTDSASQYYMASSLDGNTTSSISSFGPEIKSSLISQSSVSRSPDLKTAFIASNAESTETSPYGSLADSPAFQPKITGSKPQMPDITRSVPTMESEVLGPEVVWDQEGLTMSQVADLDNFPCVCFFEECVQERSGHREFLSPGLKIYSRQPVILHLKTNKKQARARTIYKDPRGAYYEVGQTLIIPDDYKGWFELVPSDFSRATSYLSIEEVAKALPKKFFTRSNLKGIRIEGEGDQQKYLERRIRAGSVLETKGTFTAKWKTRAETGLFKKKTTEWEFQEMTYLKCMDHDLQEILIPITHKGKFSAIYERGRLNQNAVYSMKDILSDLGLPIKVRLLFGKAPVVPCIFTGMLVIRSSAIDEAVVGSTIINKRNVLFEVPTKAPVKVKYLSKDDQFAETTTYKDAQKLCRKYARLFSSMIKLSPDLDTDQKTIMHVPTDPSVMRQVDEALRALDLITDISFTGEPKDQFLDSSDSGSINSDDQIIMPKGGTLEDLEEFKGRESQTHV